MEKRWRCEVCGYVHRGDSAPEVCPVCGVGPDKFKPLEGEQDGPIGSVAEKGLLREMIDSFMPHAVAAHFPNALLPALMLFLLLCLGAGVRSLDHGIYLLLGMIVPATALTFGSGIYRWRKHYTGHKSPLFHKKLLLGGCLLLISAEMLVLRYQNPQLFIEFSGATCFFLALSAVALCCVTLLGHYGGMLVFGRDRF